MKLWLSRLITNNTADKTGENDGSRGAFLFLFHFSRRALIFSADQPIRVIFLTNVLCWRCIQRAQSAEELPSRAGCSVSPQNAAGGVTQSCFWMFAKWVVGEGFPSICRQQKGSRGLSSLRANRIRYDTIWYDCIKVNGKTWLDTKTCRHEFKVF